MYSTVSVNTLMWFKGSWADSTHGITPSCRPQATGSSYLLRKHKPCLKHVSCTSHEGEEWTAKAKFLSKYTVLLHSHMKCTDYYRENFRETLLCKCRIKPSYWNICLTTVLSVIKTRNKHCSQEVLHLHVTSTLLKGQSSTYNESGHDRFAVKIKTKPT